MFVVFFDALVVSSDSIEKLAGLVGFYTSVSLCYVSLGKVSGGTAPIVAEGFTVYSNPLPQVLMLTAIVVGVATTALGFALIVRIKEAYGTIDEDEVLQKDAEE